MPSLLLQKPSKRSKAKDHSLALERRLTSWKQGDITELLRECQEIQQRLPCQQKPKTIGSLSKKFSEHMRKGNVHSAMKLLTNNLENGILPLDNKTLESLRQKHPTPSPPQDTMLLNDEIKTPNSIIYENIDANLIKSCCSKTKGGSGPSGMDADGWRRIILSNQFHQNSDDLCHALAKVARKLCTKEDLSASIEAFLACRLIPLDKNPGLRPIGVGEGGSLERQL